MYFIRIGLMIGGDTGGGFHLGGDGGGGGNDPEIKYLRITGT